MGCYKYPRTSKFYSKLQGSHYVDAYAGLFLLGLEFPNMGLIKMDPIFW